MKYKKKIILLAIIALLAPGLLPPGFLNSKKAVKNNQVSHAELCCCGNVASACRDCCCSDNHAESDNAGKHPVTITSCGGSSGDIFTAPKMNYFFSQSVFINYLPATTLADTTTLQLKDVLNKPPYKPPKSQLLINFT